jgi:thioredoxin 1
MFKPIVEKFAQEHPEVEVIYEDIDDCDEKQKQFKVNAVPTMIFFKDDKETARVSGVQSKKKLEQLLDEASI